MGERIATATCSMLTLLCFGSLVPMLTILAPILSISNYAAMEWAAAHSNRKKFGEVIAEQVLVHTPITSFRNIGFGISFILSMFVFLDLEFQIAPITFYCAIALSAACTNHWLYKQSQRLKPEVVTFERKQI